MGATGAGGTDGHIDPSEGKECGEVHRYGRIHRTEYGS